MALMVPRDVSEDLQGRGDRMAFAHIKIGPRRAARYSARP